MEKRDRIKELVEKLNEASKKYYQEDTEIMSNLEYDALYDELVELEKETGIVMSNSPTVHVGYEIVSELPKEAHEHPMLSLDKTKSVEALAAWLGTHQGVISWKLDGLTVVLTYENGELADYYAIIRGGVLKDIPTVLVEHAFVDDDSDFENYLSSDAKLKALAEADAKGIARYYQLTTEDGKKAESPLENYKEKIVHIIDGNCKHNKISYKTYYSSSKKETEEKSANTDTTTAKAEKQEQTTEKSAPEAKTDVISESESQEKSSEEFSNTVENTSSKSVTKPKKRESVQTDSMILFVLIAALLIALILLGTLLKKRKK